MAQPRLWSRVLLAWAVKIAPPRSREWADAMLSELEYVEGEWSAFLWALGCLWVVLRHAALDRVMQKMNEVRKGRIVMGKKAGWLLAGAFGTIALSLLSLGLLFAVAVAFPQLGLDHAEWTHLLFVIVLPLIICLGVAIGLWRRRRPVAIGILVSAAALSTHVVVHYAHHFNVH